MLLMLLLLVGPLECDPSIRTLSDQYTFGDSIGFTITNPCDTPVLYYISLEQWNCHDKRWQLVDVDVFTSYLYIGPLRAVSPGTFSFFNVRKDYGEQFSAGACTQGVRCRYGMEIYREGEDDKIVYSNEFVITSG